jgi:protein-S-isoprenylcysteine O-methyltransferase Ste14
MALVWLSRRYLPGFTIDHPVADLAGWGLIAAAMALMAASAYWFRRGKTSIIPRQTPEMLLTEGPYRLSRNPIYLADAVILTGWTFVVGAPFGLLAVPLFVWIVNRRFISGEEAVLSEKFATDYAAWRQRTRRWI